MSDEQALVITSDVVIGDNIRNQPRQRGNSERKESGSNMYMRNKRASVFIGLLQTVIGV